VDGAQRVAHRSIDMAAMGIDYLVFSGHKMYAPFGAGALIARKDLLPFTDAQRARLKDAQRSNAAGIVALGRALELLGKVGFDVITAHERALTDRLLDGLGAIPRVKLHGIARSDHDLVDRKLGVVPFECEMILPSRTARQLALHGGIGVRCGCHCAHILVKQIAGVGPVLERFQWVLQKLIPAISFPGVVRASIGIENTKADIDGFMQTLQEIAGKNDISSSDSARAERETHRYVNDAVTRVYGEF
jgi:selenocysteine lyase/cysteine desulfurase